MSTRAVRSEEVVVALPDGRVLQCFSDGPVGRTHRLPLVFHHGTPGCGDSLSLIDDAARRHDLWRIGVTRPGYGFSTRRPGRTVGDVAADVRAVLDHLRVDRCLVAGWSGGGGHALATAALLPERVAGVLLIAADAPYDADDLDYFAGLRPDLVGLEQAAIDGETTLRPLLEARRAALRSMSGDEFRAALGVGASTADRVALAGIADAMAAVFREGLRPGVDGWVDDGLAMVRPWGFAVADVMAPTTLWHGAADTLTPVGHGRWYARHIAHVLAHFPPEDGHISVVTNWIDSMLDELCALASTGSARKVARKEVGDGREGRALRDPD